MCSQHCWHIKKRSGEGEEGGRTDARTLLRPLFFLIYYLSCYILSALAAAPYPPLSRVQASDGRRTEATRGVRMAAACA